ncbi:hypothetical protein [Marinobacter sp. Arc7-DN-1]|nr:hypothetical protein [Marinobacter sp. Arc7-DN-1]
MASGRVTRTRLVDDGDTFYLDHKYNGRWPPYSNLARVAGNLSHPSTG